MRPLWIAATLALSATVFAATAHAQDDARDARRREIAAYLGRTELLAPGIPGSEPIAIRPYDWFAVEPAGAIGAEMIPVILQRILPELAKSLGDADLEDTRLPLFGDPDGAFARFGFWPDPRPEAKARPLPLGFSMTPGRANDPLPLSLAVRTCAGCHTGRVRLDDGSSRVLVGAPNTELLLHQYDAAIGAFFAKHLATSAMTDELSRAILRVVEARHAADPIFFFKDAPGHDAADEARQVATFRALLTESRERGGILATIGAVMGSRSAARGKLKQVAYSKPNSPDIAGGPPGYIDSSGLWIAAFVVPFGLDPEEALFNGAAKNDVPSVWGQRARKSFQWDANIRDELARNLVAALGLVGLPDRMDIARNVVISDFIDGLPPEPYPFAIDRAKAERGRAIYEANCVACHRPDQERAGTKLPPVFNDLGTDPNRSRVLRPLGYVAIEKAIAACYQPSGLAFTYKGKVHRPNDGLDGNALLVPRFAPRTRGTSRARSTGSGPGPLTCTTDRSRRSASSSRRGPGSLPSSGVRSRSIRPTSAGAGRSATSRRSGRPTPRRDLMRPRKTASRPEGTTRPGGSTQGGSSDPSAGPIAWPGMIRPTRRSTT